MLRSVRNIFMKAILCIWLMEFSISASSYCL
nr:unnamed protein product [Callosobruchus chinensis]